MDKDENSTEDTRAVAEGGPVVPGVRPEDLGLTPPGEWVDLSQQSEPESVATLGIAINDPEVIDGVVQAAGMQPVSEWVTEQLKTLLRKKK